jgi:dTDP-4-amino-4,6-dideoxygalactose transaminase
VSEEGAIHDLDALLAAFAAHDDFAWSKINHGFWEALAEVERAMAWPSDEPSRQRADAIVGRANFFVGGFVDELLRVLREAGEEADPHLHLAFGLSAWPDDERIIGTPFHPEGSMPLLQRLACTSGARGDGLVLKRAILDGSYSRFLAALAPYRCILVGPPYLAGFFRFARLTDGTHVVIDAHRARDRRHATEKEIAAHLAADPRPAVVLLQAGTLAPYWILRLRRCFRTTRFVDGGLALSLCHPDDLFARPFGRVYRRAIVRCFNDLCPQAPLTESLRLPAVATRVAAEEARATTDGPVAFVESKMPDHARVEALLALPARRNRWTNGGPLVQILGDTYADFLGVGPDRAVLPCANAGLGLEALARLHALDAGAPRRFVARAFSFRNLGRGYFRDVRFVDCDLHGMLDLGATAALDPATYDGLIVTNVFGLARDFEPYICFARERGKILLIDNAAGLGAPLPACSHQVFSLHHTKPFGAGEGGLVVVPRGDRDRLAALLTYGDLPAGAAGAWLNNGKLAEFAAAYHLDRLERSPEWGPLYAMQAVRIGHVAARAGLAPLMAPTGDVIATSLPFLAPRPLPIERLANPHLVLGKYYKPLAELPGACSLYERLVNVPSHPDVAKVDGDDLVRLLRGLATAGPEA